jgi:hypothetical protein
VLNGKPITTLIQRFDGTAVLIGPKTKRIEFNIRETLHEVQAEAKKRGWAITVEHLHG